MRDKSKKFKRYMVFLFLIPLVLSIITSTVFFDLVQEAEAKKSQGTLLTKYGSDTKHIVCGNILCSEHPGGYEAYWGIESTSTVDVQFVTPLSELPKYVGELEGEEYSIDDAAKRTITFPDKMDLVFSTSDNLRKNLTKFGIDFLPTNSSEVVGSNIILTENTIITIDNHEEFVNIFGENFLSLDESLQGENNTISNPVNNTSINDKIDFFHKTCLTESQNESDCNQTAKLKENFKEKKGIHTISESLIINTTIPFQQHNGNATSITPFFRLQGNNDTANTTLVNNEIDANNYIQNIIFNQNHVSDKLPSYVKVQLTKSDCIQDAESYFVCRFLNGFSVGVGYTMRQSYEFKIGDYVPVNMEATLSSGLGTGLRIPFEITVQALDYNPGDDEFDVGYSIKMLDISKAEYSQIGIPDHQIFDGSEFALYLVPGINLKIELWDEQVVDYDTPYHNYIAGGNTNFVPPLDSGSTSIPITKISIPCPPCGIEIANLIEASVDVGAKVNIQGEKLAVNVDPGYSNSAVFHNTETIIHNYSIENFQNSQSFMINLANPQYYSPVSLVPTIEWTVSFGFVFEESNAVDLPEIKIFDSIHQTHEGTNGEFTIKVSPYKSEEIQVIDDKTNVPVKIAKSDISCDSESGSISGYFLFDKDHNVNNLEEIAMSLLSFDVQDNLISRIKLNAHDDAVRFVYDNPTQNQYHFKLGELWVNDIPPEGSKDNYLGIVFPNDSKPLVPDVSILLDKSGSMDEILPTRLDVNSTRFDVAKQSISILLNEFDSDVRINLMTFDDVPVSVSSATKFEALEKLSSLLTPGGGTDIDKALEVGVKNLGNNLSPKAIILVTDAEVSPETVKAAFDVHIKDKGISVFTIAIGTEGDDNYDPKLLELLTSESGESFEVTDEQSFKEIAKIIGEMTNANRCIKLQSTSR